MKMEGSVLSWVRLMVSVSSIGVNSSELSALLLLCLISRNGVLPGFRIRLVHSVLYTNYSDGNSNSNVFFISGKSKWLHLVLDQSSSKEFAFVFQSFKTSDGNLLVLIPI